MNKILSVIAIIFVFLLCYEPAEEKVVSVPKSEMKRTVAQAQARPVTPTLPPQKDFTAKRPLGRRDSNRVFQRVPQRLKETFEQDPSINITQGHVFVSNMGAVAKEDYQSSMGEILYQDGVFNYVRLDGQKNLIPVALSPSTGRLHPISSVLHIENATEAIRSEVKGLGFNEYYYHPGIKLLSVKSASGSVLEAYSDLKDRGFAVQLEVVKPHQQGI